MKLVLTFLLGLTLATPAAANDNLKARDFIETLSQQVIAILQADQSAKQREAAFATLLNENANMRRIARFTLGVAARKIAREDFTRFQNLLGELIVKVYANRLSGYNNEQLEIKGVQQKGRNFIIASQLIFTDDRPPIGVDWWVRKEKSGEYKLFDLRVLGIWLAQEQRETFTSVLRNNGNDINVLLEYLQNQITPQ